MLEELIGVEIVNLLDGVLAVRGEGTQQRASAVGIGDHHRIAHHLRVFDPRQRTVLQNAQIGGPHRDITFRFFSSLTDGSPRHPIRR